MATAVRERSQTDPAALRQRLDGLDWRRIERELDALACATTGPLLTPEECAAVAALYGEPARFRSRVEMHRHAFGEGDHVVAVAKLAEKDEEETPTG